MTDEEYKQYNPEIYVPRGYESDFENVMNELPHYSERLQSDRTISVFRIAFDGDYLRDMELTPQEALFNIGTKFGKEIYK